MITIWVKHDTVSWSIFHRTKHNVNKLPDTLICSITYGNSSYSRNTILNINNDAANSCYCSQSSLRTCHVQSTGCRSPVHPQVMGLQTSVSFLRLTTIPEACVQPCATVQPAEKQNLKLCPISTCITFKFQQNHQVLTSFSASSNRIDFFLLREDTLSHRPLSSDSWPRIVAASVGVAFASSSWPVSLTDSIWAARFARSSSNVCYKNEKW